MQRGFGSKARAPFVLVAFAAALVVHACPASAEPESVKVELGVRTGYGIPIGRYLDADPGTTNDDANQAGASLEINSDAAGQIPIWFDLGARIGQVYVGGYIAYGIVVYSSEHADDCERIDEFAQGRGGSATCTFHGLRLGANAHYHFGAPGASIDPWLGGGFGYEWLSQGFFLEAQDEEGDYSVTYQGFELLNVQAGVDFPVSATAAFGPFIAATLASYQWASLACVGSACATEEATSQNIDDTALHTWVFLGVRGAFLL
jgi:hypothetical protein